MKNILCFCNTYYQLLVAIQMKRTIKRDDAVSVLLTNQSRGAKEIYHRLRSIDFFQGVYFIKTKIDEKDVNMTYKFVTLYRSVFGHLPEGMPADYKCDELIGFNLDLPTHEVYAALYRNNPAMVCNIMEEGLLSYDTPESGSGLLRTIQQVRSLLKWNNLRSSITKFYCFNPQAYIGKMEAVEIPKMDHKDPVLCNLLRQIFLGDKNLAPIDQTYIYLPCIYDIEGGEPIGEVVLAKELCEFLGKDNLLTKVHPRDDVCKYEAVGVPVATNSQLPFEVLCILQDYGKKKLITTLSGSILNVSAMLSEPPEGWYAYPLCNLTHNSMAKHFCGVIYRYLSLDSKLNISNIRVLENLSDLINGDHH